MFFWLVCELLRDLHVDYFIWSCDQKCHVTPHPDQGMQWCHWLWCWHHVIPMPTAVVSHDQKNHIAPHLNCLDIENTLVPLTTLLAPCVTSTGGYGVTDQESHVAPHFDCHWSMNTMVQLVTPLASCGTDANTSGITWLKHYVMSQLHNKLPLMLLLAAYDTDVSANGINYNKVMLHLSSVVLT